MKLPGKSIVFVVPLLVAGCAPTRPEGMVQTSTSVHRADPSLLELARVDARPGERAFLVVYPRTACSGSAATVLVDDRGRFLAAVTPGTATLIRLAARAQTIHAFSGVEVTAARGTWSWVDDVAVSAEASGLALKSARLDARQCGRSGQYAEARVASRAELQQYLANVELQWEAPAQREGDAWLEAHRPRVDEILAQHRVAMDGRQ